jgi:hypothetical protein
VDRERAQRNLAVGLTTAAIALAVLGLTFFAAINYIG